MAHEIKTHPDHLHSMEQRIANRLKPSCDYDADVRTTQGSGPTRVHTAIHHSGSAKRHGEVNKGEGDINGRPRGPASHGDGK
jgi:hypothetical protein